MPLGATQMQQGTAIKLQVEEYSHTLGWSQQKEAEELAGHWGERASHSSEWKKIGNAL